MRHTSGIAYRISGDTVLYKQLPMVEPMAHVTADEFIATIAALPLVNQPGTVFDYGYSIDVLGLVVERVSGMPLGEHLGRKVWDVVGMPDTTFYVPAEKRRRFARPMPKDPLSGRDQQLLASLDAPAKFACGGICAFGTVADYFRFGQMLLDGGVIDGRRVLGAKTVAMMTSDLLGSDIQNNVGGPYTFGLTVGVRAREAGTSPGSVGDYSWNGFNGTMWWNDPKEHLVVVVGMAAPGEIRGYQREQMRMLVYGALTRLH